MSASLFGRSWTDRIIDCLAEAGDNKDQINQSGVGGGAAEPLLLLLDIYLPRLYVAKREGAGAAGDSRDHGSADSPTSSHSPNGKENPATSGRCTRHEGGMKARHVHVCVCMCVFAR